MKNKTLQVRITDDLYQYLESVSSSSVSSYVRELIQEDFNNNDVYNRDPSTEYDKCMDDVVYFIENYTLIRHPQRGIIRPRLYDFQKEFLRSLSDGDDVLVVQARQMGITTLYALFSLWKTNFKDRVSVATLSINHGTRGFIVDQFKFAYLKMPDWMKMTPFSMMESDEKWVKLQNRSIFHAYVGDIVSAEPDIVLVDNFDYLPTGTKNINFDWVDQLVISVNSIRKDCPGMTANKYRFFKDLWNDDSVKKLVLPYNLHPDKGTAWRNKQLKVMGPEMFANENECPVDFD